MAANHKELIEYLSKEIETHSGHLMTFRSRIGFVVLVGPFVLMTSFLATSGELKTDAFCRLGPWVVIFLVCAFYLGLGYLFYRVDIGIEAQCNKWRCLLRCLAKGEEVASEKEKDFLCEPRAKYSYGWGFVLMLFIFCGLTYLVIQVHGATPGPP